ncbi:hypothetical protein P5P86_11415 [Nocardioides sp. BP30]|uniref:hypothetical protein n=1 Tax=Nocardioides sp. BP30 TaxID=3036374 RepID=UPI0024690A6A|nr:hypothetical protein [Nocardioides sp. BP30]WGL50571.1 hypothetical protein P5P86_11415 [Nocardioides sp. BP30]
MKLVRRLAAGVGVLALGAGLAVATGPAHAATTAQAKITFKVQDYSNPTHPRYGDYVSVTAEVDGPSADYYVEAGTVQIQAAPAGSSAWKTVASNSSYAYYSESIKAATQFRAVFSNGSGTYYPPSGDPTPVTYPTTTSSTVAISSLDRGTALVKETKKQVCYQVGPAAYKNKPIKYYVRLGKSKKWHYDGAIRTNKKSQYCYKIKHTKVKTKTKYKGPKVKAFKTVYVKSGGMKKSVEIDTF